jgi:hypothetical protein
MNAHRVPSWLRQLIRAWMNRPETLADLSQYARDDCGPRYPVTNVIARAIADLPDLPGPSAPAHSLHGRAGEPDPGAGPS